MFFPSSPFTDPFYFQRPMINAWTRATEFPTQPDEPQGTPIEIKTRVTDAGLSVSKTPTSMTLSGTAQGGREVGADTLTGTLFGTYHEGAGIAFSLDADKAPTVDRFGQTNYREKNSRSFYVGATKGASAESVANRMAKAVNAENDFRAKVEVADNGDATLHFSRR